MNEDKIENIIKAIKQQMKDDFSNHYYKKFFELFETLLTVDHSNEEHILDYLPIHIRNKIESDINAKTMD